MDEKVASYTGGLHVFRSYLKEKWGTLKEQGTAGTIHELKERTGEKVSGIRDKAITNINRGATDDYSHIYRRKSRLEMVRISAAVMGIEFCYAAETAFVSPTLLKIGVQHRHMTLIWCLSPFVGFFLTPILGSLSDNCRSKLGRRRPFIILLSIGIILGLVLVPNGKAIGVSLGDQWNSSPPTTAEPPSPTLSPKQVSELMAATAPGALNATTLTSVVESLPRGVNLTAIPDEEEEVPLSPAQSHSWGIFFTILGTMLLDFDADACQSPSRAYLLDVTLPEDHAVGLSTFTIMAGLGGGLGYAMGGINWDVTFIGRMFGGHVRAVFTLVTFIFIACVVCTLYSFTEIPLDVLTSSSKKELQKGVAQEQQALATGTGVDQEKKGYGTLDPEQQQVAEQQQPNGHGADSYYGEGQGEQLAGGDQNYEQLEGQVEGQETQEGEEESDEAKGAVAKATLRQYLLSIVYMPRSLRVLCVTNLFCWMSLVCYSLYFTDFVGEAVFHGDPKAPDGTRLKVLYEDGVRFGCWGMALYSLSCSVYSFLIEKLVKRFTARPVYVYGQLVYSVGMVFMAIFRHPAAVIVFSCCAGVMYSTLFTMPYLLVAHYHASEKFGKAVQSDVEDQAPGEPAPPTGGGGPEDQVRGLGTDVAIVSSMVFLAQFILSLCMGTIISVVGSTTSVVCMASFLAMCGSLAATQVVYLDL